MRIARSRPHFKHISRFVLPECVIDLWDGIRNETHLSAASSGADASPSVAERKTEEVKQPTIRLEP